MIICIKSCLLDPIFQHIFQHWDRYLPPMLVYHIEMYPTISVKLLQPDDDAPKKTFSGIAKASKVAAKLSTKGRIPKSCRATTMDLAKALGILGFNSTRWLDMSSGLSPKQELDKAHFEKMMNIMKKKKIVIMLHGRNGRREFNFILTFLGRR